MSKSKEAFVIALKDVKNLQHFHTAVGGSGVGRRSDNFSSLNKSGIVLLCASWEIYVEQIVIECTNIHLENVVTPDTMLSSLSKLVTKFLDKEKDDRAWHKIVNDGWKGIVRSAVATRVGILNTPKTAQVSSLFEELLNINNITSNWSWHRCSNQYAMARLNEFVTLRGSIAHGERQSANITKATVLAAQDLVTRLIDKIEDRLLQDGLL